MCPQNIEDQIGKVIDSIRDQVISLNVNESSSYWILFEKCSLKMYLLRNIIQLKHLDSYWKQWFSCLNCLFLVLIMELLLLFVFCFPVIKVMNLYSLLKANDVVFKTRNVKLLLLLLLLLLLFFTFIYWGQLFTFIFK